MLLSSSSSSSSSSSPPPSSSFTRPGDPQLNIFGAKDGSLLDPEKAKTALKFDDQFKFNAHAFSIPSSEAKCILGKNLTDETHGNGVVIPVQQQLKALLQHANVPNTETTNTETINIVQFTSSRSLNNPKNSKYPPLSYRLFQEQQQLDKEESQDPTIPPSNKYSFKLQIEPGTTKTINLIEIAPDFGGGVMQQETIKKTVEALGSYGLNHSNIHCMLSPGGSGRTSIMYAALKLHGELEKLKGQVDATSIKPDNTLNKLVTEIESSRPNYISRRPRQQDTLSGFYEAIKKFFASSTPTATIKNTAQPAAQPAAPTSSKPIEKLPGFPNVGQTCWMNAALKLLFFTRLPLLKELINKALERAEETTQAITLQTPEAKPFLEQKKQLLTTLNNLINQLKQKHPKEVLDDLLKNILASLAEEFSKLGPHTFVPDKQNDPKDCLAYIRSSIEELTREDCELQKNNHDLFGTSYDSNTWLKPIADKGVDFAKQLNTVLEQNTDTEQQNSTPDYFDIVIHPYRETEQKTGHVKTRVTNFYFNQKITVNGQQYHPIAAIFHEGPSIDSGHYTMWGRNANDSVSWHNDDKVTDVTYLSKFPGDPVYVTYGKVSPAT